MILLDGKKLAERIQSEIRADVAAFRAATGKVPGLAAVRVGGDEASRLYVRRKTKICASLGMNSREVALPESTTEAGLLSEIDRLNHDPAIHGILIQLPLPRHLSRDRVLEAVRVEKDVDGFHPVNVGRLALGRPGMVPCTPLGIVRLLDEYHVPLHGAEAVVVGRSHIVGRPLAQLLLDRHATVQICHSRTKNLKEACLKADLLVAAAGRPELIRGDWVKEGAAVVDVGINRLPDGRLTGDVCFEEASKRARWITPVPGGVGPLTIAMLLSNTMKAARKAEGVP